MILVLTMSELRDNEIALLYTVWDLGVFKNMVYPRLELDVFPISRETQILIYIISRIYPVYPNCILTKMVGLCLFHIYKKSTTTAPGLLTGYGLRCLCGLLQPGW